MLPVAPGPVALRKTLGIMLSYRWRFVGVLTLQVVAVLSTLVAPQLLGRLVTRVSGGTATTGTTTIGGAASGTAPSVTAVTMRSPSVRMIR